MMQRSMLMLDDDNEGDDDADADDDDDDAYDDYIKGGGHVGGGLT
jgi:hypothetical protein